MARTQRSRQSEQVTTPSTTRVERMLLAELTLPEWHPRAADRSCLVFGYAVRHPDGVILFDSGVGTDSTFVDDLYHPRVVPIADALGQHGIDERDVVAVVNSHLHFDHCGQNAAFHERGVPVYVQAAEIRAAEAFGYTVPEWAAIPERATRVVHGDEVLAEGVTIIDTVGHTPGHQSLVVESVDGRVILGGQCVYCGDELTMRRVARDNVHDESFLDAAGESLQRVIGFAPRRVVLAHDARHWSFPTGVAS
jgi:glyoxylase-like metal-dependent hydrolase (beta-lactamase superfamily II)